MIAIDHVEDRWLATVRVRDRAVIIEGTTFESVVAQAIAAEARIDTDPGRLLRYD
jgi:hypothetical protein